MSASDAVILLVADGLVAVAVAVGRVLGGLRARCAAEKHADALAVAEESRDSWEPDELWATEKRADQGLPTEPVRDRCICSGQGGFTHPQDCPHHDPFVRRDDPLWQKRYDDHIAAQEKIMERLCWGKKPAPVRSAAVSTPAADNTTDVDHLEAAWNYHKGAVGYAMYAPGGVEWYCEGCKWTGRTKQAHDRHRFQVLADMKNATHRITEQLGGAS